MSTKNLQQALHYDEFSATAKNIWGNDTGTITCQVKCTGCPKKTPIHGFLDITPLWKGLGTKEGCVLKKSGNFLYDTYQNFSI